MKLYYEQDWRLPYIEPSAGTNWLVSIILVLLAYNFATVLYLLGGVLTFGVASAYLGGSIALVVQGTTLKLRMQWSDRTVLKIARTAGILGFVCFAGHLLFLMVHEG